MADAHSSGSPLDTVAETVGERTVEAFGILSNETRLAILLALWEAYEPYATNNAVSFSALYDRVNVRDSGNFTYHLDKLVGHFVTETDDGYELRNAGRKIVQAVIAGAGLQETNFPPTEIDRSCHRCGAAVELSYEDEYLYAICPECEGNIGPESAESTPEGTLMAHDFNPAGLGRRTPEAAYVAGTVEFLRNSGLLTRGVCPECSGAVEASLHVCESHGTSPGEVCPDCGTRDEVRVGYVCSVCKHSTSFPIEGAVHDHPAVVAFRHEHGFEDTYALDDPEACSQLWDHLMACDHTLTSEDPIRVRVTIPGDGDVLHLTLDGNPDVIDVSESTADNDGDEDQTSLG